MPNPKGNPTPPRTDQLLRAIEHVQAERPDQAIPLLRRLLAADPANGHAHRVMSNAYLLKLQRDPAIYHARLALRHAPAGDAEFLFVLGRQMRQLLPGDEVAPVFAQAVEIAPYHVGAWIGWTEALMFAMRFGEAAAAAERALKLHPTDPALTTNAAVALENLGRPDEALDGLRASPIATTNPMVAAAFAIVSSHSPRATAAEVLSAHARFGKLLCAAHRIPPRPLPAPGLPKRPLRVGFLSFDFRAHAVSNFFEPLLYALNRAAIEPICYSTTHDPDHVTARLRASGVRFVDLPFVHDDGLLRCIRADAPDILIELNGLTAGHRLPLLRHRPAPLIGTYLGYPATTGVPLVDFRLVDAHTDPTGLPYDAQSFAIERLARLDRCFLCYRPPDASPSLDTAPQPAEPRPITFGSFNMFKKVNDDLLELWSTVLARVPGSRLLLKNYALGSAAVRADLTTRLARVGIDPARITLRGPDASTTDHLHHYAHIDIALDTAPYCGTTTTCEALFMGVPVVTLVGDRHASRVGLSLLSAVGRDSWCAHTRDDYATIAATLADGPRPGRAALRAQLLASPLCDPHAHARAFERTIASVWADRPTT
ncbi:MAG: O-linked N-acetylglucosamine transferase, SPINDLY family protein [Phycisphaerales bacterium]